MLRTRWRRPAWLLVRRWTLLHRRLTQAPAESYRDPATRSRSRSSRRNSSYNVAILQLSVPGPRVTGSRPGSTNGPVVNKAETENIGRDAKMCDLGRRRAVVTTTIRHRLPFYSHSTAIWPLYDHSTTYVTTVI